MINTVPDKVDVAVIGGGPAGATAATLLAQGGRRVRLFERERFPRFHIGESLIPETYWIFRRLGVLDKLRASAFVKKYSVQFVGETGRLSAPFYFMDHNPHDCSQTWQVLRSEFDELMLRNAAEQGVDVRQGARVLDVLFSGERATGVRVHEEGQEPHEVQADVVIDATGQSTLLANRLKLVDRDPQLRKGSVWTYFRGAQRDAGRDAGATLILLTEKRRGWFWYIPLHNDVTSVGVVASFDDLFDGRGTPEEIYAQELQRCQAARTRVAGAQRISEYFVTKDFSYRARQAFGEGWVLVGDAFGFLDPLYSSGVMLALKSGQLAADAILEGYARRDLSAAQLGKWVPTFARGMDRMRQLVLDFYDGLNFGQFVARHPLLKRPLTDLLIGDLFKDEVDVLVEPLAEYRRELREGRASGGADSATAAGVRAP